MREGTLIHELVNLNNAEYDEIDSLMELEKRILWKANLAYKAIMVKLKKAGYLDKFNEDS